MTFGEELDMSLHAKICRRSPFRSFGYLELILALLAFSLLSGCGGNGDAKTKVTAPSNLSYSQTSIKAVRSVSIQADSPTVSGSVTAYTINPTLPGGLSIDPGSGTISGTPSALASQTTYTITASNSGGSTTATIQITVVDKAPASLTYSNSKITATVGTAITSDVPTVDQAITSYSISPALPNGLTLDPASGVIAGTPTAPSPAATYTVTANNSGGSTTAQLVVTVFQRASVLLDLGHSASLLALQTNGSQVLSEDLLGHWVLWDYAGGNPIVSGDGAEKADANGISLAGQIAAVSTAQGLQVYSVTDGTLKATIPASSWYQLASDGSYIATGSATALTVWTPNGQQQFSRAGDYHNASAFAAPGQVQLALGAAGQNVIETVLVPSGTSSVSPAFSGTFYKWFTDGHRFFSNQGNTVWVYSNAGLQQSLVSLPTISQLGGMGNWVWIMTSVATGTAIDYTLQIYTVGSSSPAKTFDLGSLDNVMSSGTTLGIWSAGPARISIVDLSGNSPAKADFSIEPLVMPVAYAATSTTQWIIGNTNGAILDGPSVSTHPRYFGYGQATSISAGGSSVAIATASGQTVIYDLAKGTRTGIIVFPAGKVAFSADGSTLAAAPLDLPWAQYVSDRTLNFYSIPSLTLLNSIPGQCCVNHVPYVADFTFSGSGTTVGELLLTSIPPSDPLNSSTYTLSDQISGPTGSPATTLGANGRVPLLSPDGTLAAVASIDGSSNTQTTNIFKNGQLVSAVDGMAVGWLDNNILLAQKFTLDKNNNLQLSSTTIDSAAGATVSTLSATALPILLLPATVAPTQQLPQFPSSSTVYDANTNAIYSLIDGTVVWQGPASHPPGMVGAVSGSTVVYSLEHEIQMAPY